MSPTLGVVAKIGEVSRRKLDSLSKLNAAARKLFVERGYHGTRPQDIAREAGLGHGTFYLHYPDKRACFLAFVEDARQELDDLVQSRVVAGKSLQDLISSSLYAIFDYSELHPGVLKAAMTDEAVIDAEGVSAVPLLERWGVAWANAIREAVKGGHVADLYDPDIVGQAILGAIHQTARESMQSHRDREAVVNNLTRFLVRALAP